VGDASETVGRRQGVSVTVAGALLTAGVLGVTHAIEPDHVAGIASLTGRYGDSRLSALVGACFSAGHVALVVVWLSVGYLLLGRTEFPAVFDRIGTVGVGVLLGALGGLLVLGGVRRVAYAHSHEHDHGEEAHSHAHAHTRLPLLGGSGHTDGDPEDDAVHAHDHTVRAYLKTGVVGALFTLSPPLSMMAFSATLYSANPGLVALAVAAYAVGITLTMSALGAGVGVAFEAASELNVRVYGGAQTLAGVLVVGLAVSLLAGAVPLLG
jgi:ABC-type nickel/cobalt efflux system permease component RcnA